MRDRGIEVLSPGGYAPVTHICKTVPLPEWRIRTADYSLRCADQHLLWVGGVGFREACALRLGDLLETECGLQEVLEAEPTGEEVEMYDLRLDSDDHAYYTDGFLSHNSTGLGSRGLALCSIFDYYSILYIAPHPDQAKTYADRVKQLERGSAVDPSKFGETGLRSNLYYKEYPNHSTYKITNVLTDASKIRGNTARELNLDECQDFDAWLLPEVMQCIKATDRPVELYTGTSTTPESFLEQRYQESSKGVWMIPSPAGGGKWFSLNNPDILDDIISIDGLRCPYSGQLVNPATGEFVHESPLLLAAGDVGFHTPQIIVPAYAQGAKWLEIYDAFKSYTAAGQRSKFLQEVMGIPVLSGTRELTEGDLKRMCGTQSLRATQEAVRTRKKRYRYVISGCDWGGSDFNRSVGTKVSYTVHVMIGITPDGDFDIIHARRYDGMDQEDIGGHIVKDHVKYHGYAIGSDAGMGDFYNKFLQASGDIPVERHIVWGYSASGKALIAPCKAEGAALRHLMLNRTESISALFSDIKREGSPRIRAPHWEDMRIILTDLINSYRNVRINEETGKKTIRFIRHGAKPDDFLHALNFAVSTARLILEEPIIKDPALLERMRQALGLSVRRDTGRLPQGQGWQPL